MERTVTLKNKSVVSQHLSMVLEVDTSPEEVVVAANKSNPEGAACILSIPIKKMLIERNNKLINLNLRSQMAYRVMPTWLLIRVNLHK